MDGRLNVRQISRESYRRRSLRIANAQKLFNEGRLSISLFLGSVTSYENYKNLAVRPGGEEEDDEEDEDDEDEAILDINLEPMDDSAADEEDLDVDVNESLCVVCKINRKNAAFFPCCHFCICMECSVLYRENDFRCPMCRVPYEDIKKMY